MQWNYTHCISHVQVLFDILKHTTWKIPIYLSLRTFLSQSSFVLIHHSLVQRAGSSPSSDGCTHWFNRLIIGQSLGSSQSVHTHHQARRKGCFGLMALPSNSWWVLHLKQRLSKWYCSFNFLSCMVLLSLLSGVPMLFKWTRRLL